MNEKKIYSSGRVILSKKNKNGSANNFESGTYRSEMRICSSEGEILSLKKNSWEMKRNGSANNF